MSPVVLKYPESGAADGLFPHPFPPADPLIGAHASRSPSILYVAFLFPGSFLSLLNWFASFYLDRGPKLDLYAREPQNMSDAPESPRRPTSANASLQYPTLPPLTASVEEWLSRSRPAINMPAERTLDPPPKSLSESWATLSVSDLHSEDGSRSEQTDVGSLIDQASPDDVASLDGRYSSSEADEPDEDDTQGGDGLIDNGDLGGIYNPGSQQFPGLFEPGAAIDDSNLTTIPIHRQSIDSIEFVEPEKWPEMERVELKHTIRIFEEPQASEIRRRLPASPSRSILMATVQQTMTKHNLGLDKPFRVLYIGQSDCRNIVLDKIGDVLVSSSSSGSPTSSTESSRYHVVPTSFGAGAVPNFAELLPIHVQLVVDECVEATKDLHKHQPRTLNLSFKNRPACQSSWNGQEYVVSSLSEWTLPDVAILFISSRDDAAAEQTRCIAHAFLERHGIPVMVISDEPLWEKGGDIIPLNQNSLHVCVESRHAQTGETMVLRRYPIDLKTFESITPGQLNRNLASLIDLYPKKTQKVSTDMPKQQNAGSAIDIKKHFYDYFSPLDATQTPQLGAMLRLATLMLIGVVALSLGYAALKAIIFFTAQWLAGTALTHGSVPTATPVSTVALSEQIGSTSISRRLPGDVGTIYEGHSDWTLSPPSMAHVITTSSSDTPTHSFEIMVVGDTHVVIRPAHNLPSRKKQPKFTVEVQRNNVPLSHHLTKLFEGVYAVRLEREDAYGLVNLTIVTKTKSPLKQNFIVDFGTPWLKVANWRRAAREVSGKITRDLQLAQTGLSEACGRLSTDLQVMIGDVVRRTHEIREDAERLGKGLCPHGHVLSHSKQLSEMIMDNAIQKFRKGLAVLHHRSVHVNNEAMGRVHHIWSHLGKKVPQLDLRSMVKRVRKANSATLARAQARARYLVGR